MNREMTAKWWKKAVAYQIYPRSFMDSNGDGVGDLLGIVSKLDYLQHLGIDVIWLCPMYKSPQDDNGYDISDYQDIHHEFGTMKDFDTLLKEVHRRNMKLIIDLVVNHTSDEHPWFIESRSSKKSAKRDWYIWRDGRHGKAPNNWESIFGGSAWKYDEKTDQYFLHVFSSRQPDLNWENLQMREAIYSMIRWWIDKGIDGFRVDAFSHMKKEPSFADLPNPEGREFVPSYKSHMNVPGIQDYLEDISAKTFRKYDIMTVGEANGVSAEQAHEWVDEKQNKLSMLFHFEHVGIWDTNPEKRVDLPKLRSVFNRWQKALHNRGWNALYVENHDIPRIVSKWGDSERYWRESATAIATMYFLMQGTPFIFQGQEIGMTNTHFSSLDDFNDVLAKNTIKEKRRNGVADSEIVKELAPVSRDNARTPMQWSLQTNAGFTSSTPWLKINPNYKKINVETQIKDENSILNFYRKLIELKKSLDIFVYGDYQTVLENHPQIFAYTRSWQDEKILVLANLSAKIAELPPLHLKKKLLGNYPSQNSTSLSSFEACVYQL